MKMSGEKIRKAKTKKRECGQHEEVRYGALERDDGRLDFHLRTSGAVLWPRDIASNCCFGQNLEDTQVKTQTNAAVDEIIAQPRSCENEKSALTDRT